MNFVIWDESALDDLADVWVAATPADRVRLEAVVHRINAKLRADPLSEGESRSGTMRIMFEPPLTVWFDVNLVTSTAIVYQVARPTRR